MKLSTRDLTFFALLLAALIGGGYALYVISRTIPIPGIKYVVMSPYLSLVIMLLLSRSPRRGSILLFNAGFAGIMSLISPVMSLSIIMTGALSEAIYSLTWGKLSAVRQQGLAAASYAAFTVLTSIVFAYWLTAVKVYALLGPIGTGLLTLAAFGFGLFGAWGGLVIRKRIAKRHY